MNELTKLVSKAMLNIGSLTTDKRNTHDNYSYVSSDKILQEIGEELGNQKVIVIPGITNVVITKRDRAGDKVMFQADVFMEMTVISGEEQLTVPWFGCGVDYRVPDKAVYKAVTSGHSYFLRKMLMVGIGNEDGEHDVPEADTFLIPGEVKVPFPKAKKLFDGKAPTINELFLKDQSYCKWISEQKGDIGDAMRAYLETMSSVDREAKDTGQVPPSEPSGNDIVDGLEDAEKILEHTEGKLTPSHYWPMVRKMGVPEQVAQDISSNAEEDWRKALQDAVDYRRGKK